MKAVRFWLDMLERNEFKKIFRSLTMQYGFDIYHSSTAKNCLLIVVCVIVSFIQGCASPVHRGINIQEAKQIVTNLAGTTKPSSTSLGKYYQEIVTYKLLDGRNYKCNNKPTNITISNLTLKYEQDNSFEGTIVTKGDCSDAGATPDVVAGRYDEKNLYLYYPYAKTTYINKYEIHKKTASYDDNKLIWLGNYRYIDDVLSFVKPYKTADTIDENNYGPISVYDRIDYTLKNQDPSLTVDSLYKELDQEARAEANKAANYNRKLISEINQARSESDAYLSGYIQQKAAENSATLAAVDRQTNAAYAETNRRLAAQAKEKERAKSEQESREAERRRDSKRTQAAKTAANQELNRKQQIESRAVAEQKEINNNNRKTAKERENEKLEFERATKEEKRKQEQERVAAAKAKKTAQEAQDNADKKAKANYLQAMSQRTRLYARTCPDGKGSFYLVGKRPNISPKVVDCIDVNYRAYCQGSRTASTGTIKNFLGLSTDCFMGDAAEITPKLNCAVDQVNVEVTSVKGCGNQAL